MQTIGFLSVVLGVFLFAVQLVAAPSPSCEKYFSEHFESVDTKHSSHFDPKTGDGLVIMDVDAIHTEVQWEAVKAFDKAIETWGPGRHRIFFYKAKPDAETMSERAFDLLFGDKLYASLMEFMHESWRIAEAKLPKGEGKLKVLTADIRFVSEDQPHSTYTHYDYYEGDYLVEVASFLGPGMVVKSENNPNGESIPIPVGQAVLFNAVGRWQRYHGVQSAADAVEILKWTYFDVKAARAGAEYVGPGPVGLDPVFKAYPGTIPVVHHAPSLVVVPKKRVAVSIVYGIVR